jgi:hypothetical protein
MTGCGACRSAPSSAPAIRANPARIVGGRVVQAENDFSYQISGNVIASGGIAVTVSKGLGSATGYGRLHGDAGGGRWSAGNNQCYGTWSAMRRASN